MKIFFLTISIFVSISLFGQQNVPDGFVKIFNGKDFSGWNIKPDKGAWKVENGVMHCYGKPNEPYVILTEKNYENFELMLEFRMSPRCNSGVMVHQPDRGWGRESRVGMELQVSDDAGRTPDVHSCGAIYNAVPPTINAVRPAGHWNSYHITIDWPILQIELNGQMVQNANLEDYPDLKYRLRTGHIGLQNHGREVEYRNIFVRELPAKEPSWTELFNGKDLSGWEAVGDAKWTIENGELTATGGEGYLISKSDFAPNYELHIYAAKREYGGNSGLWYNWASASDPGYKSEFYDAETPNKLRYMEHNYYLTQIVNYGTESTVRLNGIDVQRNAYQIPRQSGKIAIFHSAGDGKLVIAKIKMKKIEPLPIQKK